MYINKNKSNFKCDNFFKFLVFLCIKKKYKTHAFVSLSEKPL